MRKKGGRRGDREKKKKGKRGVIGGGRVVVEGRANFFLFCSLL